jgi:hypothetical protein
MMKRTLRLAGLIAALTSTVLVTATPAQAADHWEFIGTMDSLCAINGRTVDSSVPGAEARFIICWNDSLSDVRVHARVRDTSKDDLHAEARIRYRHYILTMGWGDWYYRAPAVAYGPEVGEVVGGPYKARYKTKDVQAAACVYNGDTLINCDDAGWQ